MYIKNKSMKGTELRLRNGVVRHGDPEGIIEIDDEQGNMLLNTKGWEVSEKAPQAPESFDPVAALKRLREEQAGKPLFAPPSPTAATPGTPSPMDPREKLHQDKPTSDKTEEKADSEEQAESEDDETGPDLSTMDRTKLIAVATEYGIKLTAKLKKGSEDELRAFIDNALYGESENEGE
jgi:hypothetical protein